MKLNPGDSVLVYTGPGEGAYWRGTVVELASEDDSPNPIWMIDDEHGYRHPVKEGRIAQPPDNQTLLTAAFHAVYDVKDRLKPGSDGFHHCYSAIGYIQDVMNDLGVTPPRRRDRKRN
jgi:hypothetical protein